jgi:hypothetical protein
LRLKARHRGIHGTGPCDRVCDPLGGEVAALVDAPMLSGSHVVTLNANSLPNGIYYYRLTVGRPSDTKKLALIK